MRGALLLCAAVCGALLSSGCSPRRPATNPAAEREALLIAQDRFWDAFARQNLEEMEPLLDAGAVLLGQRNLNGRSDILSFLRGWFRGLEIQAWEHSRQNVRLLDGTALISHWREESGLADGAPYRVNGWISEAWSRRGGSWQILLIHIGANQTSAPGEQP